jgi:hypothetical protein
MPATDQPLCEGPAYRIILLFLLPKIFHSIDCPLIYRSYYCYSPTALKHLLLSSTPSKGWLDALLAKVFSRDIASATFIKNVQNLLGCCVIPLSTSLFSDIASGPCLTLAPTIAWCTSTFGQGTSKRINGSRSWCRSFPETLHLQPLSKMFKTFSVVVSSHSAPASSPTLRQGRALR